MNELPDGPAVAAPGGQVEFVRLGDQIDTMRGILVQLLQDVVRAESRLDHGQAVQILEANGQLVMSALDAQLDAEAANDALDEASRIIGLDALTGLPNRTVLLDRFDTAISNAKRHGKRVALLFLDLDAFKQVNDNFGHAAGDRALQWVAACLTQLVRGTDTVSRHGGDEFLILLGEIAHSDDAALVAQKITAALAEVNSIDGHAVKLAASIGIGIYPEDGTDAKTLIVLADAAMYLAKRQQAGGFVFHADSAHRPLAPANRAAADHEQRHAYLREANEKLVLAALAAQALLDAAEEARQRQSELLVRVADLLDPRRADDAHSAQPL